MRAERLRGHAVFVLPLQLQSVGASRAGRHAKWLSGAGGEATAAAHARSTLSWPAAPPSPNQPHPSPNLHHHPGLLALKQRRKESSTIAAAASLSGEEMSRTSALHERGPAASEHVSQRRYVLLARQVCRHGTSMARPKRQTHACTDHTPQASQGAGTLHLFRPC